MPAGQGKCIDHRLVYHRDAQVVVAAKMQGITELLHLPGAWAGQPAPRVVECGRHARGGSALWNAPASEH